MTYTCVRLLAPSCAYTCVCRHLHRHAHGHVHGHVVRTCVRGLWGRHVIVERHACTCLAYASHIPAQVLELSPTEAQIAELVITLKAIGFTASQDQIARQYSKLRYGLYSDGPNSYELYSYGSTVLEAAVQTT